MVFDRRRDLGTLCVCILYVFSPANNWTHIRYIIRYIFVSFQQFSVRIFPTYKNDEINII